MKEIENQADREIEKLRNHFDEIIARLTEIKSQHEKNLKDNLIKKTAQVNRSKTQHVEQKKNLVAMVKFMEENNSAMSDYKLINHHRDLSKLVSAVDVDIAICEISLRYTHRELCDDQMDSLMGQIVDLENFNVTETNSFQYNDKSVTILISFDENESSIKFLKSEYIEHINKQGDKKHKYDVYAHDLFVTDTGYVYFTDYKNRTIGLLSPSEFVYTVVSTRPLTPGGICQSVGGGLLVTLKNTQSQHYTLNSHSRRLVRHMSRTGDVIREYEYHEDGQTRLFILPYRVQQNGNSDICVVNRTSDTTGHVVIMSLSGRLRSAYHGQNLSKNFFPSDVACDSRYNILLSDVNNHRIHLLSPDGKFLKFLLTENEVHCPTAISLFGFTLWVGNVRGTVKLFQF